MPIHETSYLSWEGSVLEKPRTWLVIARTGIRLAWKKLLAGIIFAASIPFLVRTVQIYLASQIPDEGDLALLDSVIKVDETLFMDFMRDQLFILFVILAYCGAGLIANDRKFKALSLYFSRPVDFRDYVIGKFLVIFFYGSVITIAPALLLFLVQLFVTKEAGFFAEYYWVPFAIVAQGVLFLVVLGGFMLAISSWARGVRSAIVAFFALLAIPAFIVELFQRYHDVGWIAITRNLRQLSELLYGRGAPYRYPVWAAVLSAAAVVALSIAILRWRIKPTEVVK
jgi:ABC-type transport system involved in multi-copper enzyme maturation permease subunit